MRAPVFIKPGCSPRVTQEIIRTLLEEFSLERRCEIMLTEAMLRVIYDGIYRLRKRDLWGETKAYLLGKKVLVLIFHIKNRREFDKLVERVGSNLDPEQCAEHSLRYRFGSPTPKTLPSGKLFFYNFVHRPKTPEEARRHFAALFSKEDCIAV